MENNDNTNFPEENPETTVWELMTEIDIDPLTGLPNRRKGEQYLQRFINRAEDGKLDLTLVYIDADNFGVVNKKYGQEYGDGIMTDFAAALKDSVRPSDSLFREAGDEYYIVSSGFVRKQTVSKIEKEINEKVRAKMISRKDYSKHPELAEIGVTIGLARYKDGDSPRSLINRAEELMRSRKKRKNG